MLLVAWATPLAQLAAPGFAGHALVHVAVAALAAPFVAAGLAASRALMARLPESLVSPMPVALGAFALWWLWYIPILHGLARLSPWVGIAEQLSCFAAGLLLWTVALRPGSGPAAILALLLTALHTVLLGLVLMLAPRPLYPYAIDTLGEIYAVLASQRTGGMLMLLGGGLAHLAGGLYLAHRLLNEPPGAATGRLAGTGDAR